MLPEDEEEQLYESPLLAVGCDEYDGNSISIETIFRFPISRQDFDLIELELTVYESETSHEIDVFLVYNNWSQETINWTNKPTKIKNLGPMSIPKIEEQSGDAKSRLNLTGLIPNDQYSHLSFLLVPKDPEDFVYFFSYEAEMKLGPKLITKYDCVFESSNAEQNSDSQDDQGDDTSGDSDAGEDHGDDPEEENNGDDSFTRFLADYSPLIIILSMSIMIVVAIFVFIKKDGKNKLAIKLNAYKAKRTLKREERAVEKSNEELLNLLSETKRIFHEKQIPFEDKLEARVKFLDSVQGLHSSSQRKILENQLKESWDDVLFNQIKTLISQIPLNIESFNPNWWQVINETYSLINELENEKLRFKAEKLVNPVNDSLIRLKIGEHAEQMNEKTSEEVIILEYESLLKLASQLKEITEENEKVINELTSKGDGLLRGEIRKTASMVISSDVINDSKIMEKMEHLIYLTSKIQGLELKIKISHDLKALKQKFVFKNLQVIIKEIKISQNHEEVSDLYEMMQKIIHFHHDEHCRRKMLNSSEMIVYKTLSNWDGGERFAINLLGITKCRLLEHISKHRWMSVNEYLSNFTKIHASEVKNYNDLARIFRQEISGINNIQIAFYKFNLKKGEKFTKLFKVVELPKLDEGILKDIKIKFKWSKNE